MVVRGAITVTKQGAATLKVEDMRLRTRGEVTDRLLCRDQ